MSQITSLTLSSVKNTNRTIVSMGYDSIESNIILSRGDGAKLPDPLIDGPYDILWWNASDYIIPTDDPHVEIVRCIAKIGDTLVVMRSQQQTSASPKNIPSKIYNMMYLPSDNIETLSYFNVPQAHGIASHTGNIGTEANITFSTTVGHAHTGTDSKQVDHTNLTSKGSNTHADIDTALTASAGHISANGTSVHGLGTMSTQASNNVSITGGSITSNNVSITGGSITGITDLAVTDGGTGQGSAVAYTPICGGTTTTSAYQSVASAGSSGQVLTSNGASALPTFQAIPASGWTLTTTSTSITASANNVILCNATSGAITITLPAASSNTNKIYGIKKIDSSINTITIDGNASETIDGALTQVISSQYDCLTIMCDGSNWYII
jgi:hypothetical protein